MTPVTYKQAVKMLNGLCEGLGDSFAKNYRGSPDYFPRRLLSKWVNGLVLFYYSDEGFDFWMDIQKLLREIESGDGTSKEK